MVLAELYITFEIMTFAFFLKGLDDRKIIYPLISMGLFFTLAVMSFSVDAIFTGTTVSSFEGGAINFGFAMISLLFAVLIYMDEMRKGIGGEGE